MKKEMPKWAEKSPYEKSLLVISMILSVFVILFATLSLTGIWQGGDYLIQPLLGVVMLVQALQLWKYNRAASLFSLLVAILAFAVLVIKYFFR